MYSHLQSNWNKIFLIQLLDSLSDMDNRQVYKEIAVRVNYNSILRERGSLRNLEALLIGISGLHKLLPNDDFSIEFKKNAEFLLHKYQIEPFQKSDWNLRKITPVKHPIIRLSQVARLLYDNDHPFNQLLNCKSRNDILSFFDVEASLELCQRVNLRAKNPSCIGVTKRDLLGINLVVPMMYAYGLYVCDDTITDRAGELNESLPAESNWIISSWCQYGLVPTSALETQGLIQLTKRYCPESRCEECPIGRHIMSPKSILRQLPNFFVTQL